MKLGDELFDVEHEYVPDYQVYTLKFEGKQIVDRWPEFERKLLGLLWRYTIPKHDNKKKYQEQATSAAENGMTLSERVADPNLSKLFHDGMVQSQMKIALMTYIEHVIRGPWPEAEETIKQTGQYSYYRMIIGLDENLKQMDATVLNKNQPQASSAWDYWLPGDRVNFESAEVLWIKHQKGEWTKGLETEKIAILLGRDSGKLYEITSPREGILRRAFKRAGQVIEPGGRLIRLDRSDASWSKLPPEIRPAG